jgi:hypothetical protein
MKKENNEQYTFSRILAYMAANISQEDTLKVINPGKVFLTEGKTIEELNSLEITNKYTSNAFQATEPMEIISSDGEIEKVKEGDYVIYDLNNPDGKPNLTTCEQFNFKGLYKDVYKFEQKIYQNILENIESKIKPLTLETKQNKEFLEKLNKMIENIKENVNKIDTKMDYDERNLNKMKINDDIKKIESKLKGIDIG